MAAPAEPVEPIEKETEEVQKGASRIIVAAVDESKSAEDVFNFVHTHFNDAGTKVAFVYVVKPLDSLFNSTAAKVDEKEAKKHVAEAWVKRAEELKTLFQAEAHILKGDAREELQNFTRSLKPATLVIGSHGVGAVKRALLGSVSNFCVHHCPCPVTVVRSADDAAGKEAPKEGVIQNAFQVLTKGFLRREKSVEKKEAAKEATEAQAQGQPSVETVQEETAEGTPVVEQVKEGNAATEVQTEGGKSEDVKTQESLDKEEGKDVKELKEAKEGVLQSALHVLTKPFAKKEKPAEKRETNEGVTAAPVVLTTEATKDDAVPGVVEDVKEAGQVTEAKADEVKEGEEKVEEGKAEVEAGKEEVKGLKENKETAAKEGVLQNALLVLSKTFTKKEKPEKKEATVEVAPVLAHEAEIPKEEIPKEDEAQEMKDGEVPQVDDVKEGEGKVEEGKPETSKGAKAGSPKAKEGVLHNAFQALTKSFRRKSAERASTVDTSADVPKDDIAKAEETMASESVVKGAELAEPKVEDVKQEEVKIAEASAAPPNPGVETVAAVKVEEAAKAEGEMKSESAAKPDEPKVETAEAPVKELQAGA